MEERRDHHRIETSEPTPVELPYDRVRQLVPAIVVCLLAMTLILVFLIESLRADQLTLSFRLSGLPIGDQEILDNHGRLARDTTLLVILGAVAAILWLIWQYRAHANLRPVVPGTRFPPLLAVALWVVPGLNLVGPPLAMRELWRAAHPERKDWRNTWTTPLLWLWWGLVLSSAALGWWALAPAWHANPTLEQLYVRDHRAVIACGVGMLAGLSAAAIIAVVNGRVSLREDLAASGRDWRGWAERGARRR
jgi:Domain of unknown function (DUF4328)